MGGARRGRPAGDAGRPKELTRGHEVGAEDMREFIAGLGLPAEVEERLLALTPATYIGLSERLARWEA